MASSEAQTSVAIGDGILAELGQRMRALDLQGRAFVITDERVGQVHGEALLAALEGAGYRPALSAVQGGEGAKSLAQAGELYAWLADEKAERRDTVVALGGGVIGDLAGFVAATYLRGVPAGAGADDGAGAGRQLRRGQDGGQPPPGQESGGGLPPGPPDGDRRGPAGRPAPRELRNGWAEVIKTAAIFDAPLFETLEATPPEAMDRVAFLEVIERCVRWKMQVVEEDPRERGPRMLLNFGHTIGHALEAACGYETYLHGEAVAIGMVGAAQISRRLGLVEDDACGAPGAGPAGQRPPHPLPPLPGLARGSA